MPPLTQRLVQAHTDGHGDVQAAHLAVHGQPEQGIAAPGRQRSQAPSLGTEDQDQRPPEIGPEQGGLRLGRGAEDPRAGVRETLEPPGEVRQGQWIQIK